MNTWERDIGGQWGSGRSNYGSWNVVTNKKNNTERSGTPPLRQDEGWSEVVRKKNHRTPGEAGRLDVASSAWKISYKDTISFYFNKFPETHGAMEMLRGFKLYGEAMEVVIPPKRDKRGKHFGFVHFSNFEDPRLFAIKLDNIIFGANKNHVNIPRFQRENNETVIPKEKPRLLVPILQHQQPALKQQQRPTFQQSRRVFQQVASMQQQHPTSQQQRQVIQVWRKKAEEGIGGRKVEGHIEKNIPDVCCTVPEGDAEVQKNVCWHCENTR